MIGAIIGAVGSIAGSAIGGALSAKANRRAQELKQKYISNAREENERWYQREYNSNELDRADAQYAATRLQEAIRNRNQAMAGRQAVMGGSDEAMAAEKERNAEMLSNYYAQTAARGSARKDTIENQYRERKADLNAKEADMNAAFEQQKGQNVASTVNGVVSAVGNLATSLDGSLDKSAKNGAKTDPTTGTVGNPEQEVQAYLDTYKKNHPEEFVNTKSVS